MPDSVEVWFATSNDDKFEEATNVLKQFAIVPRRLSSKGSELQSPEPSAVAAYTALRAFRTYRKHLFVEDTVCGLVGFEYDANVRGRSFGW